VKVLIASDKFKGSLTANEVCKIIGKEIQAAHLNAQIISIPLADGGEGTCELLTHHGHGNFVTTQVMDPLMRPIVASYGISQDHKTAFVEMAKASGLMLLKPEERNCMITSTFGTGQLILDAVERGVETIVLGLGGSATNDAGMGMARALGIILKDKHGVELKGTGEELARLAHMEFQNVNPRIIKTKFIVLTDVTNPLYGETGAAKVFARQKGASEKDIEILDEGLRNFSRLATAMNCPVDFPGAGAAGGLGAGSKLFLGASVQPSMEFISMYTKLEEKISHADLIITGEGKLDKQTLDGKVVSYVAARSQFYHKPVVAVTGSCELDQDQLEKLGISEVISLINHNTSLGEALDNAGEMLSQRIREFDWQSALK